MPRHRRAYHSLELCALGSVRSSAAHNGLGRGIGVPPGHGFRDTHWRSFQVRRKLSGTARSISAVCLLRCFVTTEGDLVNLRREILLIEGGGAPCGMPLAVDPASARRGPTLQVVMLHPQNSDSSNTLPITRSRSLAKTTTACWRPLLPRHSPEKSPRPFNLQICIQTAPGSWTFAT